MISVLLSDFIYNWACAGPVRYDWDVLVCACKLLYW